VICTRQGAHFDTFRAWLSTSETAAADRLLHSRGRDVPVNGLIVAEDWDGLVSSTLLHPIDVDEMSQTQNYRSWTGTLANGQPAFGSEFCNGWTTFFGDFMGGTGLSSVVDTTGPSSRTSIATPTSTCTASSSEGLANYDYGYGKLDEGVFTPPSALQRVDRAGAGAVAVDVATRGLQVLVP